MERNTYIEVLSLSVCGRIINVRFDDRGEPIYTVELDNCTDTPDGLYIARESELRPL